MAFGRKLRKPPAAATATRKAASEILATERLGLRRLGPGDAPFILRLVNDPSWLEFIGDKGVRTEDDARNYLAQGPIEMYARLGFGLYLVELRDGGVPIGICGLIKRESLPDVDIGFAYLPEFRGKGYAHEAALAVMAHAKRDYSIRRLVAITAPENERSIRLLARLGMTLEKTIDLPRDGGKSLLFGRDL
jgi:RimJ/RimL family protein N-acetyltransferase